MAELKINARFKDAGIPKIGLSPTVTILNRSTGETDVSSGAMTEVDDGFYEFRFTDFNIVKDYLFSFDGTATLADVDRFLESEWSGIADFIATIPRAIGGRFDVSKLITTTRKEFEELREALEGLISSIQIDVDMGDIRMAITKSSIENEELHEKAIETIRKSADESIKRSEKELQKRIKEMRVEVSTESLKEKAVATEKIVTDLLSQFGDFMTSSAFLKKQLDNSKIIKEQTQVIEKLLNDFGEFLKSELKK